MLKALTLVFNTAIHRFASTLTPHYPVPQLNPLLSAVHSTRSAAHHTLTSRDMTVPLLLSADLICRLPDFSNFLHCYSQGWISLFLNLLSLSRPRRFWQTSSLDVRGFVGRHTTRCCRPLLQYDVNKLTCG